MLTRVPAAVNMLLRAEQQVSIGRNKKIQKQAFSPTAAAMMDEKRSTVTAADVRMCWVYRKRKENYHLVKMCVKLLINKTCDFTEVSSKSRTRINNMLTKQLCVFLDVIFLLIMQCCDSFGCFSDWNFSSPSFPGKTTYLHHVGLF